MSNVELDAVTAKLGPKTSSGCRRWLGAVSSSGYPVVKFRGKTEQVTRVLWELKNEQKCPASLDVAHKCDDPLCVAIEHLTAGTTRENMHDMFAKGRAKPHGKRVPKMDVGTKEASALYLLEKAAGLVSQLADAHQFALQKTVQDRLGEEIYERTAVKGRKKVAFEVSEYSGPMGPVRFKQHSQLPPFRMPPPVASVKEAFSVNPMGRLLSSRSVGLPKISAPPGPSIAQIAKPVGYGKPMAGATKTV